VKHGGGVFVYADGVRIYVHLDTHTHSPLCIHMLV
jgi:hypothetical protein